MFDHSSNFYTLTHWKTNVQMNSFKQILYKWVSKYICKRTRPKSLEWCARLIRNLYRLIRLIWIDFLDFWVDWTDLVHMIGWLNKWERSILYSSRKKKKKNTSVGVDSTSTGALLPGEANPTHTQTMEFFHED